MKIHKLICALLAALPLVAFQCAQPPPPGMAEERPGSESFQGSGMVIQVNSNLVTVPVSVTDNAGRPVRDLQIRDFQIEENGRAEPLTRVADPGQAPVELVLLLDVSGSTRPRFQFEQQAAARFLRRILGPEDRFSIFSIGPQPDLLQSRTANIEEGLQSLAATLPSGGSTAFYDAVVQAARLLSRSRGSGSRRVQVVLSDGEDNNSESSRLAEALEEIQRADCIFYSINPGGLSIRLNKISLEGQEAMSRLADQTGGAAFVPERAEDLIPIFDRIAAGLRDQYLLEYCSSDQRRDGAYRRISVRVPGRPDLHIRARQGYYASQG